MIITIILLVILYITISLCVGVIDASILHRQIHDINDMPYGDVEFVSPKKILGIHNIVFFPSLFFFGIIFGFKRTFYLLRGTSCIN